MSEHTGVSTAVPWSADMRWALSVFDTAALLLDGGAPQANAPARALAARAFPTRSDPPP